MKNRILSLGVTVLWILSGAQAWGMAAAPVHTTGAVSGTGDSKDRDLTVITPDATVTDSDPCSALSDQNAKSICESDPSYRAQVSTWRDQLVSYSQKYLGETLTTYDAVNSEFRGHFGYTQSEVCSAGPNFTIDASLAQTPDLEQGASCAEQAGASGCSGDGSDNSAIRTIASSIAPANASDAAKVRAIHDWLRKNLSYDIDNYCKNSDGSTDIDPVSLVQKINSGQPAKTDCSGYSRLFAALARASGLRTRLVDGQVFGASDRGQGQNTWTKHEWDEVLVNGKFTPIDVTWDSADGSCNPPTSEKIYRYAYFGNTKYFQHDHKK